MLENMLRRPLTTLAIVVSAGLAAAIVVNAVGMQQRAHPAPLFAARPLPEVQNGATPRPARAQTAPQPVPQPVPTDMASLARQALEQPITTSALPATLPIAPPARPADLAAAPSATAPAAPRDAIGDLLRGQADRPADRAPRENAAIPTNPAPAPAPVDARVAAAQRALTKLGYGPLRADGVAGIGTRLAIENFEKDRRLPLSGELSARVARELSAASGIAIE